MIQTWLTRLRKCFRRDRAMKHKHVGPLDAACDGCFHEARLRFLRDERTSRRFWGWVVVGFSLALAAVSAFVLWRIGMGR